jgi:hypothetical protein
LAVGGASLRKFNRTCFQLCLSAALDNSYERLKKGCGIAASHPGSILARRLSRMAPISAEDCMVAASD